MLVRQPADVPLLGARAYAAALLSAGQVTVETRDPVLRAFVADVAERAGERPPSSEPETGAASPDAVLLAGLEEEGSTPLPTGVPVWHANASALAVVVDGSETDGEWIGLAEDLLLHDGRSPRSARLVWAPDGLSPDDLLDAMAGFRELFPARPDLDGTLQMPRAFLKAAGTAHAWAPGFMLSKGDPEPQPPGHVRWASYASLDEVRTWAGGAPVIAGSAISEKWGDAPVIAPGDAHRPPLAGHRPESDALAFLLGLSG